MAALDEVIADLAAQPGTERLAEVDPPSDEEPPLAVFLVSPEGERSAAG